MTDPKLREARIAEAKRRAEAYWMGGDRCGAKWNDWLAACVADVIAEDWRPEPEVDAVEAAFKAWDQAAPFSAKFLDAFRAGHARALENCADVRRVDWLEGRDVFVTQSGGGMTAILVDRVSRRDEPLRTKIDRAMGGGQ